MTRKTHMTQWMTLVGTAVACAAVYALTAGAGEERRRDDVGGVSERGGAAAMQAGDPEGIAGWCATYSPVAAASGKSGGKEKEGVVRAWSASAAFALQKGQSFHPAVAAAGVEARFDAVVDIPTRGKYRFGAESEGGETKVTVFGGKLTEPVFLTVTGEKWTEWIDLAAGPVNVRYTFVRGKDLPVRMRALWERQKRGLEGFFGEPIPTIAVEVSTADAASVRADREGFAGRVRMGEMGCTACHAAPKASGAVLTRRGPDLRRVGERASIGWMARFIAEPGGVKPGCDMPGMLAAGNGAKEATDIAHYLASLSRGGTGEAGGDAAVDEELAKGKGAGEGDVERGKTVFRQVGCIACHGTAEGAGGGSAATAQGVTSGFEAAAEFGDLKGKWRRGALAGFVREPEACRPGGRMPSLLLSEDEARDVEAYLLSVWGEAPPIDEDPVDAGRVEAGRAAFGARSCAACHALAGQSAAGAKALARVDVKAGCLDASSTKGARYAMSAGELAAVRAGVEQMKRASGAVSPTDLAARTMEAMSCTACHFHDKAGAPALVRESFVTVHGARGKDANPHGSDADGKNERKQEEAGAGSGQEGGGAGGGGGGGGGGVDLGDEGRLPPTLVGVGSKLSPGWMSEVLARGSRVRGYMSARMPVFSAEAIGALGSALAASDGVWGKQDEVKRESTDAEVQAGRTLMGSGGLSCISCHTFDSVASGTVGIELTTMATRLRRDWFERYMKAPERFKPGTRMPNFYLTGTGPTVDVFAGDAHKQVSAMWSYLERGGEAPLPQGVRVRTAEGNADGEGSADEGDSGAGSGEVGAGESTELKPPGSGGAGDRRAGVGNGGWDASQRAMVFRAKFPGSGARSIGVGSRDGVHFVFDADACVIRYAWTGPFADASGSWEGRAGETLGGLGAVLWRNSARTAGHEACRFEGYSVDGEGVPTFRYRQQGEAGGWARVAVRGSAVGSATDRLRVEVRIGFDGPEREGGIMLPIAGTDGADEGSASVIVVEVSGGEAAAETAGVRVRPAAGEAEARVVIEVQRKAAP